MKHQNEIESWKGAIQPKCDYDFLLQPHAEKYLLLLKSLSSAAWYHRILAKREMPELGEASNFIVRNPFDPISKDIDREFVRVSGRQMDPLFD